MYRNRNRSNYQTILYIILNGTILSLLDDTLKTHDLAWCLSESNEWARDVGSKMVKIAILSSFALGAITNL